MITMACKRAKLEPFLAQLPDDRRIQWHIAGVDLKSIRWVAIQEAGERSCYRCTHREADCTPVDCVISCSGDA